jgi:short-subunit dehydrogenase
MRKQNSGLIINITSIAGYMGLPYRGIYSASKGALELVSEAISIEVKPFGINIVNIAPGEFATDIAAHRYHAPILENSAYKPAYENTLGMMNSHMHSGEDPNDFAKEVYNIIKDKNPNLHYKIGAFMQKFSVVLKRILPDRVYESMLMNHYKL